MVDATPSRPAMEAVDAGNRQSDVLPSINYLTYDKIKAEDQRHSTTPGVNMSTTPALASPHPVPSGPPPPYSYNSTATTTASAVPGLTGLISPPESRRTSGDEKEPAHAPPRQSLPSIFEALGEPPLPYSAPPNAHAPVHKTSAKPSFSPNTSIPRSHPPDMSTRDPSQPQRPQLNHTSSHHASPASSQPTSFSAPLPPPPPQPQSAPAQADHRRAGQPNAYSQDPHLSSLPAIRTGPVGDSSRPDVPASRADSPALHSRSSPRYEQGPPSATSMPTSAGFGGPFQQHHQAPYGAPPAFGHTSGSSSAYHSPTTFGAQVPFAARFDGSEVSRVQEAQQTYKGFKGVNAERYGNSVKRHLDIFDLEASLNEIADSSGRTNEFSRAYIQRFKDKSPSRSFPGSLPSLVEIDEVIRHQDRVRDLLARMREMLVSEQSAFNTNQVSQDHYHKSAGEYDLDDGSVYNDDGKSGGLLGPEAKKRRGRAAPPGRCHSCNRAETPEWRRGPDGARTLCNACGLHYAKLTRKMGSSKGSVGSSSLRPKSMGPSSPRPHP